VSDIVAIQTFVKDYLSSRVSLRLVAFVEENDQTLAGKVNKALAGLGICGIIGSVAGNNPTPESKLIDLDLTFGVRIKENVAINRDKRVHVATVIDEAERLALSAAVVSIANVVHQENDGTDYVLLQPDRTSPASWARLLTATQALELVIRALHFQHPTTSTTICFNGFDEHNSPSDAQANFDVRVRLDPAEVP
jgi:hypothetical protein